MDIVDIPIEQIKPYKKNPRKNEKAVPEVVKSLREFGFRQPLVVDSNMVLIVGHTRLLAAKELGLTSVPVHIASTLTPAQVRAYRIADNRSHDRSEWDVTLLNEELGELFEMDEKFDLGFMDFSSDELGIGDDTSTNPDYSVMDGEDDSIVDELKSGVKKAVQIEFDLDDYETVQDLIKYWRKKKVYIGAMIIEKLIEEKEEFNEDN